RSSRKRVRRRRTELLQGKSARNEAMDFGQPAESATVSDGHCLVRTRAYPPIWMVVGLWMESHWTRQMDRSGSTVGSLNAGCQPGRGGPLVADVRRLSRSTVTGGVAGDVRQEAVPAGQARCCTLADTGLFGVAGGGRHDQPGAKRSLSP